MLARLGELIWQKSNKKRTYLRGSFCFHVHKNMAQNNKISSRADKSGEPSSKSM